eukprot:364736-Lingulodinium_polyedra.AAC.1
MGRRRGPCAPGCIPPSFGPDVAALEGGVDPRFFGLKVFARDSGRRPAQGRVARVPEREARDGCHRRPQP